MRGLTLLIRRPVCRTALNLKRTSQEPLRFNSSSTSPKSISNLLRKSTRGDNRKLPDGPCRTRFAPSPTGYLHLGSLRTALYNYLLAKATGGQFLLRIEDTDQTRLVPDAEERLYQDLKWAGLSWDEGPDVFNGNGPYGPYRQSERLALYDEHAEQLIREGRAYRCFCSPEDLEHQKREAHARGEPTHYQGTCRSISLRESDARAANGESFAVRFKSAEKPLMIHDMVYGRYQKNEREEDFIIRKRDGFPTYHFANVVDDRLMQITHVIRGAEWLISTPKHVEMYAAFGWEPPAFAHVGLLVDKNRRKLSKRDSGVDMSWYKDRGILPSTLLNFAVLLGWGRPSSVKSDVMTLNQMVDNFIPKFSRGDIVVDLGKLPHLQTKHLRELLKQLGRVPDIQTKEPADLLEVPEPDRHILSQLRTITEPIMDIIKRVEATKKTQQQTPPPTNNEAEDDVSTIIAQTAQVVGENLLEPYTDIYQDAHISEVLRANNTLPNPLDHPSALARFVAENWFLFFSIPESTLRNKNTSSISTLLENHIHNNRLQAQTAIKYLEDFATALKEKGMSNSNSEVPKATEDAIKSCVPAVTKDNIVLGDKPLNPVKLFWAVIRWALTTVDVGPSVVGIVQILGQEETLKRLEQAKRVLEGVEKNELKEEESVEG
ncbi:glutamyl-tRNA synthetase [Naviculisporaceae sp. PSN 640]